MPLTRQHSASLQRLKTISLEIEHLRELTPKTDAASWKLYCDLTSLRAEITDLSNNKDFAKHRALMNDMMQTLDNTLTHLHASHPELKNRVLFNEMSFDRLKAASRAIQQVRDQQQLQIEDLTITRLGANNIPLFKVSKQNPNNPAIHHNVAVRFIDDQRLVDIKNQLKHTPAQKHLAQQFICKPVEMLDENHVHTYMEISEFFNQGDLSHVMRRLHETHDRTRCQQAATGYARNLIEMMLNFDECGVCFTDIKPSNFMVNDNNQLVISDMKSLFLNHRAYQVKTKGQIINTEGYRAPEQFISRVNLDKLFRSDDGDIRKQARAMLESEMTNVHDLQRYQIGVTIYEIVTNHLVAREDRNENGEHRFNFNHPAFDGPEGNVLRNIIVGLTNPIPKARISFADAMQLLHGYYQSLRTTSRLFQRANPPAPEPNPMTEVNLDDLMRSEQANHLRLSQ